MSQWKRQDDRQVPPEIVAAIVAALQAAAAIDSGAAEQSRWLRQVRRHIADWGDQPESWLDRARLRAVQRDR